jgi:methyl-accepting chemotaxis protein
VEEINAAIEQTEAQATELDRIVDIFGTEEGASVHQRAAAPVQVMVPGARGLQEKLKSIGSSYLRQGNAALDKDWNEF